MLTLVAPANDTEAFGRESRDVWGDEKAMQYLRTRQVPVGLAQFERRRLQRYAHQYTWQSGHLYRRMGDNSTRIVPPPNQRAALLQQTHDQLVHLGERRNAALLMSRYWWSNLYEDV